MRGQHNKLPRYITGAFPQQKGDEKMKSHLTKYTENGKKFATSWLQINIFGKCFCFNKKTIAL